MTTFEIVYFIAWVIAWTAAIGLTGALVVACVKDSRKHSSND